jgi:hypothetical protein
VLSLSKVPTPVLNASFEKPEGAKKSRSVSLGGSVTAGHGVQEPDRWPTLYGKWWRDTFPNAEIQVINGVVPASETNYFMACFEEHIDRDSDLVVIEMAINDRRYVLTFFIPVRIQDSYLTRPCNRFEWLAKSYEYLLRALLQLPSQPAVVNLHVSWLKSSDRQRTEPSQVMALSFATITMGGDLHA